MVDAAAALWNAVPTAGVALVDEGPLNEDVSGANILVNSIARSSQPATLRPRPPTIRSPSSSMRTARSSMQFSAPPPAAHAARKRRVCLERQLQPQRHLCPRRPLLNGLCATSSDLLQMMSFELERAFGRILGLDYAQVNPGAHQAASPDGTLGWPVMQPSAEYAAPRRRSAFPTPPSAL